MDRIKRGTPATISNTWTSGTTTLDPGTVTIGIVAADGSVVVAPGTATSGSGAAARTFNLTTTHTAKLDRLTATWTSSTQGVDDTIHEIVGDYLCSLSDLRAIFTDTAAYPDAKVRDIRTAAEVSLEKACGRAFVPRYALERRSVSGGWVRTRPDLRTVRSLTVGGTAYTTTDIDNLVAEPAGLVHLGCGYSYYGSLRSQQVTIGYEYGTDSPDADITRGVLLAAREIEGLGNAPAGVRSQSADNMTVTYATQGSGDAFADSALNAIIRANSMPAVA